MAKAVRQAVEQRNHVGPAVIPEVEPAVAKTPTPLKKMRIEQLLAFLRRDSGGPEQNGVKCFPWTLAVEFARKAEKDDYVRRK